MNTNMHSSSSPSSSYSGRVRVYWVNLFYAEEVDSFEEAVELVRAKYCEAVLYALDGTSNVVASWTVFGGWNASAYYRSAK